MLKHVISLGAATIVLSGCAALGGQKADIGAYQRVAIPDAEIMPDKSQLQGERTKVVIFQPDDKGIVDSKTSQPGSQIAANIEQNIAKAGVEIVDRSLAKQLEEEIQLAEMKGSSDYKGPDIANFAITGKVASATVTSDYEEGYSVQREDGSVTTYAPACETVASLNGNLKVYQLPSLTYVKTISIEGRSSYTEDAASKDCTVAPSKQQKLMAKASQDAVYRVREQFQNFFAPKAYILERRESQGHNLFRVSLGDVMGFTQDTEVEIYRVEQDDYQDGELVEYRVAQAKVVEAAPKYAWVELEDDEKSNRVKRGNFVKAVYRKKWWETVTEAASDTMAYMDDLGGRTSSTKGGVVASPSTVGASSPTYGGSGSGNAEVVEATWSTSAYAYRQRLNQDFRYICPPNGRTEFVYGGLHNKYQTSSSVCTTAVYAGLLDIRKGGMVTIRIIDNKDGYPEGESKQGIYPRGSGSTRGFVFVK